MISSQSSSRRPSSATTRSPNRSSRTSSATTATGFAPSAPTPTLDRAVQAELNKAFLEGPGIVVFKRAFPDTSIVDAVDGGVQRHDRRAAPAGYEVRRPLREAWRQRPGVERAREVGGHGTRRVRQLLRQRHPHHGVSGLARTRLHLHLAGQCRQPRRRGAEAAPRLPPRVHDRRPGRRVSGAPPQPLRCTHAARGDRSLRHAGRDWSDDVPAARSEVSLRVPGVVAAGVPRILRAALRAVAVAQGRRRVLQPGALPRGRNQPHHRRAPHGQPAADQLSVRQVPGERSTTSGWSTPSTRRC